MMPRCAAAALLLTVTSIYHGTIHSLAAAYSATLADVHRACLQAVPEAERNALFSEHLVDRDKRDRETARRAARERRGALRELLAVLTDVSLATTWRKVRRRCARCCWLHAGSAVLRQCASYIPLLLPIVVALRYWLSARA